MPRWPKPLIVEAEAKQEPKQEAATHLKAEADEGQPLHSKPGTRGPDGKRVPPPPHPSGNAFPPKEAQGRRRRSEGDALQARDPAPDACRLRTGLRENC
jgi:hypothetical protein